MQTRRRTPTFFELMFFLLLLEAVILPADATGNSTSEDDGSGCVVDGSPYAGAAVAVVLFASMLTGAVGSICIFLRGRIDKAYSEYREIQRRLDLVDRISPLQRELVKQLGLDEDVYCDTSSGGQGEELFQWCRSLCKTLTLSGRVGSVIDQETLVAYGVIDILVKEINRCWGDGKSKERKEVDVSILNEDIAKYLELIIDNQTPPDGAARLVHKKANEIYQRLNDRHRELTFEHPHSGDVDFSAPHYVHPQLTATRVVKAEESDHVESEESEVVRDGEITRLQLENLLSPDRRHIVLSGDHSSGRTAFINYLCCVHAQSKGSGQPMWNDEYEVVMLIPSNFLSRPEIVNRLKVNEFQEIAQAVLEVVFGERSETTKELIEHGRRFISWDRVLFIVDDFGQLNPEANTDQYAALTNLRRWLSKREAVIYVSTESEQLSRKLPRVNYIVNVDGVKDLNKLLRALLSGTDIDLSLARQYMRDCNVDMTAGVFSPGNLKLLCSDLVSEVEDGYALRNEVTQITPDTSEDDAEHLELTVQQAPVPVINQQQKVEALIARWQQACGVADAQAQVLRQFMMQLCLRLYLSNNILISHADLGGFWQQSAPNELDVNMLIQSGFFKVSGNVENVYERSYFICTFDILKYFVALACVEQFVANPDGDLPIAWPEDRLSKYAIDDKPVWKMIVGILGDRGDQQLLEKFFIRLFFEEVRELDNPTLVREKSVNDVDHGGKRYVNYDSRIMREVILPLFEATGIMQLPGQGSEWRLDDNNVPWKLFRMLSNFNGDETHQRTWSIRFWEAIKANLPMTAYRIMREATAHGCDRKEVIFDMLKPGSGASEKLRAMVLNGDVELINFVLVRGDKRSLAILEDRDNAIILSAVESESGMDSFNYLRDRGAFIDGEDLLLSATKSNSIEIIRRVIEVCEEGGMHYSGEYFVAALCEAIEHGSFAIANWLIETKLTTEDDRTLVHDFTNRHDHSLLHIAAMMADVINAPECREIIRWLVRDCGIDVDVRTGGETLHTGNTPFMMAVVAQNEGAARLLVEEYQANSKALNDNREHALFDLCRDGVDSPSYWYTSHDLYFDRKSMTRFLLSQELSFDTVNAQGERPEHYFPKYREWVARDVNAAISQVRDGEIHHSRLEDALVDLPRDVETGDADAEDGAAEEKNGADGGRSVPDAEAGASALGQFGGQRGRSMAAPLGDAPVLG